MKTYSKYLKNKKVHSKYDKIAFNYEIKNDKLIIDLDFNLYRHSLYGKAITLNINNKLETIYNRWETINKNIFSRNFIVNSHSKKIIIDMKDIEWYSYNGYLLKSSFNAEIVIDDSIILFDTKLHFDINKEPNTQFKKLPPDYYPKKVKKNDRYNITKNFLALSPKNRLLIIWAIIFSIAFSILFFYFIFVIIFLISAFVLKKAKAIFSSYWDFRLDYSWLGKHFPVISMEDLLRWSSKVDLENAEIRVVAYNLEKWIYETWWKNSRQKEVTKATNWIILYSRYIPHIKANVDISEYNKWEYRHIEKTFNFHKIYTHLYPPFYKDEDFWVDVKWEVQIVTNDYVDIILEWKPKMVYNENF